MVDVYVSGSTIDIGRQGENEARDIYFDLTSLIETYGDGTATLVHMRPSDQAPYVCGTTVVNNYLVWRVVNTDTAYPGSGKCELRWVVGDTLAKSIIYTTTIAPSITGAGEVPSPYQSWYDAIIAYIEANYSASGAPREVRKAISDLLTKAVYTEGMGSAIATVQAWVADTLTVTNVLTHVTTNNGTETIPSGQSYQATLTAVNGYTLGSVTVSMGGVDITATVYSSGTITIPSVTGDIVITATAVAAVSSLSAVYTQSGSVYDTDTLDTLKTNLVVTATYEDSSTATIPGTDYTLSGTLAVGTSTITVSYAGKTATFTVTVEVAPIPSVYELSAATVFDGTNYIDTEYILTNQDKDFTICFEFTPNSPSNGAYIFDTSHNSSNALNFRLAQNGSGYYRTAIVTAGSNTITASTITNNAKVVLTHTAGESTVDTKWAINGGSTASSATTTLANFGTNSNYLSQTQTMILGAKYNTNDYRFTGTINQFVVYESVLTDAAINQFLGVSE